MKKYLFNFYQEGEGCDYTVGCGLGVHSIEAEDYESAVIKFFAYFEENFSSVRLAAINVYEYQEVSPITSKELDEYYRKEQERLEAIFENERRKERYKQYIKLKDEFEENTE